MKVEKEIKQKIYDKYIAEGEAEIAAYDAKVEALNAKQHEKAVLELEIANLQGELAGVNLDETRATLEALYAMRAELENDEEEAVAEVIEEAKAEETKEAEVGGIVEEAKQDETEQAQSVVAPAGIVVGAKLN